jgi:hypothetical protein
VTKEREEAMSNVLKLNKKIHPRISKLHPGLVLLAHTTDPSLMPEIISSSNILSIKSSDIHIKLHVIHACNYWFLYKRHGDSYTIMDKFIIFQSGNYYYLLARV